MIFFFKFYRFLKTKILSLIKCYMISIIGMNKMAFVCDSTLAIPMGSSVRLQLSIYESDLVILQHSFIAFSDIRKFCRAF